MSTPHHTRIMRFALVAITWSRLPRHLLSQSTCKQASSREIEFEPLLDDCVEKLTDILTLKGKQKQAILSLLAAKDVVAILPTGF